MQTYKIVVSVPKGDLFTLDYLSAVGVLEMTMIEAGCEGRFNPMPGVLFMEPVWIGEGEPHALAQRILDARPQLHSARTDGGDALQEILWTLMDRLLNVSHSASRGGPIEGYARDMARRARLPKLKHLTFKILAETGVEAIRAAGWRAGEAAAMN